MKILALDIAGQATGWALGTETSLQYYGKYISNLKHSRGQRLHEFGEFLEELFTEYQPDIILIERPFLGRNSKVLVNLSKFVAIAELTAFKVLELSIEDDWFVDPRAIKRTLKIRKPKKGSKAARDDNKFLMVKKINSLFGLKLKYRKNKNKQFNDDDIADAIAVYAAWLKSKKTK